jgi:hypothetical protein
MISTKKFRMGILFRININIATKIRQKRDGLKNKFLTIVGVINNTSVCIDYKEITA